MLITSQKDRIKTILAGRQPVQKAVKARLKRTCVGLLSHPEVVKRAHVNSSPYRHLAPCSGNLVFKLHSVKAKLYSS